MPQPSPSRDSDITSILVGAWVFIGLAMVSLIVFAFRDVRAASIVERDLPAVIQAAHLPPDRAQPVLAPLWGDLQKVGPLALTPVAGGSRLRWEKVSTEACESLRRVLVQSPRLGQGIVLIQNAAIIDPESYADLPCMEGGHISEFTFTITPRS